MTTPPPHRPDPTVRPVRPRRRGRLGVWTVLANMLVLLLVIYAVLSFSGRPLPLPGAVAQAVAERVGASVGGSAEVGAVWLTVGRDGRPRATLHNVTLMDGGGAVVARLDEMSARLSPVALATARVAPSTVALSGAQITLRRAADGRFAVSFGAAGDAPGQVLTLSETLTAIDDVFAEGPLSAVEAVTARDVTLTLEDARSGRIWQATNATLDLQRDSDAISLTMLSDVFNGTDDLGAVQVSFRSDRMTSRASIGATISGLRAADIALQSPALSFLGLLDAPVDGSVRAHFDAAGGLEDVAASLDIGAGAFAPAEGTRMRLAGARAYLRYDPEFERIDFAEISATSDAARIAGSGHAYLRDADQGWPERLVGQFQIDEAVVDTADLFGVPVAVTDGAVDVNLHIQPFRLEIGQAVVSLTSEDDIDPTEIWTRGSLSADRDGWTIALDFGAEQARPGQVLAHWPLAAIAGTRRWVDRNVLEGDLRNLSGAIRVAPGAPLGVSLKHDFRAAKVRFLEHFPPIEHGVGRAIFEENAYTVVVDSGQVDVGDAGVIDVSGSVFRVGDVTRDPARGDIDLVTSGPLEAALRVLDNKPLSVLEKTGFDPGLATAEAAGRTRISLELLRDVRKEDVDFRTDAVLRDVRADGLVGGRSIGAEELTLTADPEAVEIAGQVQVDGVPVEMRWRQALSAATAGRSTLAAEVEVSAETLAALGIAVAPGVLSGATTAELSVDLVRDEPAAFRLASDLEGLGLRIAAVDWAKAAATPGAATISGTLGDALTIDTVNLDAAGLAAEGRLTLTEDVTLASAEFDRVRIGSWFDAPVLLRPRGDETDIAILGGRIDLDARPSPSEQRGGGGGELQLALDELVLSDGLSLRPFTAILPASGAGRFDSRINGRSPIRGTLQRQNGGMAIRVRSEDGGRALADARILPGAVGGTLDMVLVPDGAPGGYRGQLSMEGPVLRDAPAMAYLLDGISVVGLLDEFEGQGIRFETVDARFRLSPGQLAIQQASAEGASLGLSLDGTYDLDSRRLNMQGVLSPLYILNGVGSLFTRRGEGLFGVSFRLSGAAADPSVEINPLSILTPGALRDIFRQPAPG